MMIDIIFSLIGIAVSIIIHELGHAVADKYYGCFKSFELSKWGIAVVSTKEEKISQKIGAVSLGIIAGFLSSLPFGYPVLLFSVWAASFDFILLISLYYCFMKLGNVKIKKAVKMGH